MPRRRTFQVRCAESLDVYLAGRIEHRVDP